MFFNHVLKEKFAWPAVGDLHVNQAGQQIVATAKVTAEQPRLVEFFFSMIYEIDPDRGPEAIPSSRWEWSPVESKTETNGVYTAQWTPPPMRVLGTKERLYNWGDEDVLDPKQPSTPQTISPEKWNGEVQAFARGDRPARRDGMLSLAAPVSYPAPAEVKLANGSAPVEKFPSLEGAARIKTVGTIVEIHIRMFRQRASRWRLSMLRFR